MNPVFDTKGKSLRVAQAGALRTAPRSTPAAGLLQSYCGSLTDWERRSLREG